MFNATSSGLVSPKFIKARTLLSLERRMRELILKNGKKYDFYFFQETKEGFIAWYREDLEINFTQAKPNENED